MKKLLICLTAVIAGGALTLNEKPVEAQPPAVAPAPVAQPQPARPRIALVNIAKVMREFGKAKYQGETVTKKRQEIIARITQLRQQIAELGKKGQMTPIPDERAKIQAEAVALTRQLEDVEREGQKTMTEMTDHIVVDLYQNIKTVVYDIAVTNNLDLVMCYPDTTTPEEERKPVVAQMKLQTPALFPLYHRNMDITDVVINTLNRRHPAPAMPIAAPGQAPSPGIVPTGGKR